MDEWMEYEDWRLARALSILQTALQSQALAMQQMQAAEQEQDATESREETSQEHEPVNDADATDAYEAEPPAAGPAVAASTIGHPLPAPAAKWGLCEPATPLPVHTQAVPRGCNWPVPVITHARRVTDPGSVSQRIDPALRDMGITDLAELTPAQPCDERHQLVHSVWKTVKRKIVEVQMSHDKAIDYEGFKLLLLSNRVAAKDIQALAERHDNRKKVCEVARCILGAGFQRWDASKGRFKREEKKKRKRNE